MTIFTMRSMKSDQYYCTFSACLQTGLNAGVNRGFNANMLMGEREREREREKREREKELYIHCVYLHLALNIPF